jgi:hypothetical protein
VQTCSSVGAIHVVREARAPPRDRSVGRVTDLAAIEAPTALEPPLVAAGGASPAAELAACVAAAGLVVRDDLAALVLRGEPNAVARITGRLAGVMPATGRLVRVRGSSWCATSPGRVVVVGERERHGGLAARLEDAAARWPGAWVADMREDLVAVGLLGPRSADVLAALGAEGPPPASCRTVRLRAGRALAIRDCARQATILVRPDRADAVWHAAQEAGRPHGLVVVGAEAVARHTLLERRPLSRSTT